MASKVVCECGARVVAGTRSVFLNSLDIHEETEKHTLLLQLRPESHALALNPKTEKDKCQCG
jgi:hypothetical protein